MVSDILKIRYSLFCRFDSDFCFYVGHAAPNSFASTDATKAAPALLPVASSTALPGAGTFQRPSALDAVPRPAAASGSVSNAPPPYVPPEREYMRQIAEMCAKQGTQSLDELRSSPENRFKMPFIYDGNPGYDEFKNLIIEFARNIAQQTAAAAAAASMGVGAPRPIAAMPMVGMPAIRPPLAPPNLVTMPQMQPRPLLQPPAMAGLPRPMMVPGPRPSGLPTPNNLQPPSFPGQQPPRRSRFG